MLEQIRAWLNGKREYYSGVAIYAQAGTNKELLQVLMKGPNDFRVKRLQEDLLQICNELKIASGANNVAQNANVITQNADEHNTILRPGKEPGNKKETAEAGDRQTAPVHPRNETLYNACELEAKSAYKKVMNDRAILFSLANSGEAWEDPNQPHKINDRVKLAIDIVTGWQHVSQLYDKADYVKLNGRLPADQDDTGESEYDHLQDHLVKLRLDNARKALNKLKAKEQTPERIALMQKHDENIKKLEAKWHSLKPAQ